ncbi:hypothetical protein C7M84_012952 [Penaeus vannamei]|uniref:Uncharacterized protein n=1 Tax=Penaeus vannamei TaxID=6689 RepID=A0A3R7QIV7_PENVA|nr:hypothetical protein C7M84_012952 [Penaeus vannamei]
MTERQAPMDFFLEVEASVFQGYRDHRGAVGEPSELIRRVFLAGLPSTLRDLLVLKDDCSPIQLAETAQKLWNSRYGIRHSSSNTRHQSPNNIQEDDYQLRRRTPDRPPRTRDRYDLFPVATSPSPAQSLSSPPTSRPPGNAELLRVSLHHQPTLVSVVEGAVTCLVSAPFREARKEGFPTSLATLQEGTRTRSITVQTEPVQTTAAVTTPAVGGRPVVALSVDGKTLLCFIDTGSQVTLVKPSALEVIDPAKKLRHYASSKILQGVSGEPSTSCRVADLSFHGDVLLGTDFLRRQDFTLQSEAQSPHGLLILGGCELSLLYTDAHSLQISLSTFRRQLPGINLLSGLALRTNSTTERNTQPRSTGGAAAGRDRCPSRGPHFKLEKRAHSSLKPPFLMELSNQS